MSSPQWEFPEHSIVDILPPSSGVAVSEKVARFIAEFGWGVDYDGDIDARDAVIESLEESAAIVAAVSVNGLVLATASYVSRGERSGDLRNIAFAPTVDEHKLSGSQQRTVGGTVVEAIEERARGNMVGLMEVDSAYDEDVTLFLRIHGYEPANESSTMLYKNL